ncbi:type IV pilin-like G/H family protein [Crocosphaera sp. UHCC 0190]|uniref:type IV pilin-like G/H family protein n=1 Tax=Crocosphaera sp. UHCC 0190 TaxID=3110246 RepID=UPI002B21FCEA|nr:type IV pilin-like G/H family protein [Crocosphaera sp. UHCC 0190]MEA5509192.1 type IV pilin-like G/H family protein [Crocosphaera sp. UHCC 0190]
MTHLILKGLIPKKQDKGFTLIELLVVAIIIGILASILFPQTMNYIGRARESEAKGMMGTLNRAQQTFFNEKRTFATGTEQLEVPVGNEKYYIILLSEKNDDTQGLQGAVGKDNGTNATRDYAAGVAYDPDERIFSTVVCRSTDKANQYGIDGLASKDIDLGTGKVGGVVINGTTAECDTFLLLETIK